VQGADKTNGLNLSQFRHVVGKGHPDFSTKQQQDAEQYIRHLFEKIDENVPEGQESPVDAFRFKFISRLQDISTGFVSYTPQDDYILPLTLPMDLSTEKAAEEENAPAIRVLTLKQCLDATFEAGLLEYTSPVTGEKDGAMTSMGIGTFPDYLIIQLKRFALNDAGEQVKLGVEVEIPDEINLNEFHCRGLGPDETPLPETVGMPNDPSAGMITQLVSMGFPESKVKRAVKRVDNIEAAMDLILDMGDEQEEPATGKKKGEANTRDGIGKYQLRGFISQMGTSVHCGHYVTHLRKDGVWYIFNDDKVAVSQKTPKAYGYLYLYERMSEYYV